MGKAGAAAVHIEDQVGAKRCGHRPGKELVAAGEMVDRIKAAVDARTDEQFVIMARTDALANEGLAAAIERAQAYVAAGADMIFAEAVTELAMYTEFRKAVGVPILANITEFGQTPLFTRDELRDAGVDIILYCCAAYRAMNAAALNVYESILAEGTQKSLVPLTQTRAELYEYLDYHAYERKLDELFAMGKGNSEDEKARRIEEIALLLVKLADTNKDLGSRSKESQSIRRELRRLGHQGGLGRTPPSREIVVKEKSRKHSHINPSLTLFGGS